MGDQKSTARLTVEEPGVVFTRKLPDETLSPLDTDAVFIVELSQPDVEVTWFKKGKPIKPSSKYEISIEGNVRKLVVKNVKDEDQTEYTCQAMNVKTSSKLKLEGKFLINQFRLLIFSIAVETSPKITLPKTEYRVKKGEDITLEAQFTARPQPTDEWTINGKVVKKSKKFVPKLTESSASLTIFKTEDSDVGTYTIKLRNNCGEASAQLNLKLMGKDFRGFPLVFTQPINQTIPNNSPDVPSQPGTPEIAEVADDHVTIYWKAPESDGLSPITHYILEYHDKDEFLTWHTIDTKIIETTHTITSLQQSKEYNFKITAVNEIGPSKPSNPSAFVKIETPKKPEPPVIQEPLKDCTTGLKKSITLSSVISGVPKPEITWSKDGRTFKNKNQSFESCLAKYVITETHENSGGVYKISAKNSAGTAETTCELRIQEAPVIQVDEKTITQKLKVTSQWKIDVKVLGHPVPEITWLKNNTQLETTKHCTIYTEESSTSIAIYSLQREDTGIYEIIAKNSAGEAKQELNLRVVGKLSLASNLTLPKSFVNFKAVVVEN